MAGTGSTGTWITGTIRGTDTVGLRQREATGRSTISRGMRLGMGKGIPALPGIAAPGNIALGLRVVGAAVAEAVVGAEAAGTR